MQLCNRYLPKLSLAASGCQTWSKRTADIEQRSTVQIIKSFARSARGDAGLRTARKTIAAAVLGLCLALALTLSVGSRDHVYISRQSLAPVAGAATPHDWLQFNVDPAHSGNNTLETSVSQANVAGLVRLFQVALPGIADGAPGYLSGVTTSSGTQDLLFVTTKAGDIVALDAHTGNQLWIQHNPAGDCLVNNSGPPCYTTSSPAIDPNRQFVYSYGLDGKVHKYQVGDGMEVTDGGWPELVTLKPFDEKGSSALATATARSGASYLYVTTSGYLGDGGDYQGHVTTINLADGSQNVFNSLCSDQAVHIVDPPDSPSCGQLQSGIWARAGVVYDPDTNRLYVTTGNGTFDPLRHNWGDTVLALNPDGTGTEGNPVDNYTPADFRQLQARDIDLGSTAPAVIPAPANSNVPHLAVLGGKDALLRLLNLDNLSGQAALGQTGGEIGTPSRVPQGGQILTAPAIWVNPGDGTTRVIVVNDLGISALTLSVDGNGNPALQPVWQNRVGGTSPIVANNVLYYASKSGIEALDPTNGVLLWQDAGVAAFHWESPIVANGALYVTDQNGSLTAYGLP